MPHILALSQNAPSWNFKLKQQEATSMSLTTDIWTSIANDAYLTVSVHFISIDWTLCSAVVCTSAFPERHTGLEIYSKLKGTLYMKRDPIWLCVWGYWRRTKIRRAYVAPPTIYSCALLEALLSFLQVTLEQKK